MAYFIPEMLYPYVPKDFNGFGSCSVTEWLPNLDSMSLYEHFGSISHIDMSDFDETIHISEQTALEKTIMEFPNGVKLVMRFYVVHRTDYGNVWDGVAGYVKYKYNNTYIDNIDGATEGGIPGIRTGVAYTCEFDIDMIKRGGIKLTLVADYSYDYGIPVEDVTKLYTLQIKIWAPQKFSVSSTKYEVWRDYWTYVDEGISAMTYTERGVPNYDFWYGGVYDTNQGYLPYVEQAITWTDMESFLAGLKSIDPTNLDSIEEFMPTVRNDEAIQEGDPSGEGGGDGNYDNKSDPIDFAPLPTNGALSSGAIKAFAVNKTILTAVFTALWSTNIFDIAQWQKLLESPLDSLVELSAVPINPTVEGAGAIKFGNFDTNVSAPIVNKQYYTIDCGSIKIQRYWGSALDYEPYTKCEIYLPFIGVKNLKTDDVMNTTVHIKYNIDILTGEMVAMIKCGQSVLYHFNGMGKATIPVSSRVTEAMANFVKGNAAMFGGAIINPGLGVSAAISSAINVAASKTNVDRSGSISGSVGLLDDFIPYIIIHRPVQSLAKDFKTFKGYPSNITATLSSLKGYTEVEFINLQNIPNATSAEMDEIKSLLSSGVLL